MYKEEGVTYVKLSRDEYLIELQKKLSWVKDKITEYENRFNSKVRKEAKEIINRNKRLRKFGFFLVN